MCIKNLVLFVGVIGGSIALQGRAAAHVFGDVPGALAATHRPSIMLAYYDPSTGRYVNENLGNSRIPLTGGNTSPSQGYSTAGGSYIPSMPYGGYGNLSYPGYSYGYPGFGSPYPAFGGGYPLILLGSGNRRGTTLNGRTNR